MAFFRLISSFTRTRAEFFDALTPCEKIYAGCLLNSWYWPIPFQVSHYATKAVKLPFDEMIHLMNKAFRQQQKINKQ